MSVLLADDRIRLVGPGLVEDAELLLTLIEANPRRPVDWSEAGHLHAAIVQVLLRARPPLVGRPIDTFLLRWLLPVLSDAT